MQARWDAADQGRGRNKRIIAGILLMILGIAIMVWVPALNIVLAVIGEIIAGIGGAIIAMSQTVGMSMESGITVAMMFNLLLVLLSLFASGRTRYAQSANHSS